MECPFYTAADDQKLFTQRSQTYLAIIGTVTGNAPEILPVQLRAAAARWQQLFVNK